MKLFKIIAIIISLAFFALPSFAAGVGGKSMRAIANGELKDAKVAFSNQTIVMKRPGDGSGYNKHLKGVPISGTFVAYIANNGKILIWSKDNDKIISGRWKVSMSKEQKPRMIFCMSIAKKPQKVPCMLVNFMGRVFYDSEEGNMFNLRAGAAVPAPLPYSRTLSTIENKIK